MSGGLYSHTTRAAGSILTAAIYNADHTNHITNADPEQIGNYADTVAEYKTQTDPGGVGTESLPTNLAGEIARLRFAISRIVGKTEWYEAPSADLEDVGGLSLPSLPLSLANGGLAHAFSDPNADRIFFWDDSAGHSDFLTVSTGLAISGTSLSLSHLGLQSLTNPGADRIFFWDDSASAAKFLAPSTGISITGTNLSVNQSTNWAWTGNSSHSGTESFTNSVSILVDGGGSAGNQALKVGRTDSPGVTGAELIDFVMQSTVKGSITLTSANINNAEVAYNTTSDGRLKKDRAPIHDSGEILDRIEACYFTWIEGNRSFGLIAQNVAEVLGPMSKVNRGDDGEVGNPEFKRWEVQYGSLEPILIAEIQSLRKRVKDLEDARN